MRVIVLIVKVSGDGKPPGMYKTPVHIGISYISTEPRKKGPLGYFPLNPGWLIGILALV